MAYAFEGIEPFGEAPLGYPLNLLNLYFDDSAKLEPNIALQKA